ncbi:MAG TPA: hypothetical protein VNA25_25190 [Phycisphaerae bacterium]|nr:hypothetical protein [Phycisphaerae bacterium]HUT61157.1 hypothetical protein [Phycisphaerae bacterium]
MSGMNTSGFSGKRFEFGRGAGKSEYLLAGGLGVVIIAALALAIWGMFGGRISGPKAPTELHYKCEKCQHEFTVPLDELTAAPDAMDELQASVRDCPSCGAKQSCWRCIECPNCKKYYISQSEKARLEAMRIGRTEPEGIQDKCPYCQTVMLEWYREHRNKK